MEVGFCDWMRVKSGLFRVIKIKIWLLWLIGLVDVGESLVDRVRIYLNNYGSDEIVINGNDTLISFIEEMNMIRVQYDYGTNISLNESIRRPKFISLTPLLPRTGMCRGNAQMILLSSGDNNYFEEESEDNMISTDLTIDQTALIKWPISHNSLISRCLNLNKPERAFIKILIQRSTFTDCKPNLRLNVITEDQPKTYNSICSTISQRFYDEKMIEERSRVNQGRLNDDGRIDKGRRLLLLEGKSSLVEGNLTSSSSSSLLSMKRIIGIDKINPVEYFDQITQNQISLSVPIWLVEDRNTTTISTILNIKPYMISSLFEIISIIDLIKINNNTNNNITTTDTFDQVKICLLRSEQQENYYYYSHSMINSIKPWCVEYNSSSNFDQVQRFIIGWPISKIGRSLDFMVKQTVKITDHNNQYRVLNQKIIMGPTQRCLNDCNNLGRCSTYSIHDSEFRHKCHCLLGWKGESCETNYIVQDLYRLFQRYCLEVTNIASLIPVIYCIYTYSNLSHSVTQSLVPVKSSSSKRSSLSWSRSIYRMILYRKIHLININYLKYQLKHHFKYFLFSRDIGTKFLFIIYIIILSNVGWWSTVYHKCESTGLCFDLSSLSFKPVVKPNTSSSFSRHTLLTSPMERPLRGDLSVRVSDGSAGLRDGSAGLRSGHSVIGRRWNDSADDQFRSSSHQFDMVETYKDIGLNPRQIRSTFIVGDIMENTTEDIGSFFSPPLIRYDEDCLLEESTTAATSSSVIEKMLRCQTSSSSSEKRKTIRKVHMLYNRSGPARTSTSSSTTTTNSKLVQASLVPSGVRPSENLGNSLWIGVKRLDFYFAYVAIVMLPTVMARLPLVVGVPVTYLNLFGVYWSMIGVRCHELRCVKRVANIGLGIGIIPFLYFANDLFSSKFVYQLIRLQLVSLSKRRLLIGILALIWLNMTILLWIWMESLHLKIDDRYWIAHSIWHLCVETTPVFWLMFKFSYRHLKPHP